MPIITLTIAIEIENYQDVVRDAKGDFTAFLAGVPIINWPIMHKVDSMVAENVKAALISSIGPNVTSKLAERGIKAHVEVT